MTKEEMLNKLSDIETDIENLQYEFKKNLEELKDIFTKLENLPHTMDEIENSEPETEG